jgi:hypothetical protein
MKIYSENGLLQSSIQTLEIHDKNDGENGLLQSTIQTLERNDHNDEYLQ